MTLSATMMQYLVYTVLVMASLCFLSISILRYNRKRSISIIRRRKKKELVKVLKETMKRNTLFVIKKNNVISGCCLSGGCVAIHENKLIIDVGPNPSALQWLNAQVTVVFNESPQPNGPVYEFISTVLDTAPLGDHYTVVLAMPKRFVTSQRRRFVRLVPQEGEVLGAQLWFKAPNIISDRLYPKDIPPPHVSCSACLVDLSAGGLGLELAESDMVCLDQNEARDAEQEDNSVLLRLSLRGMERERPLRLLCIGKIMNRMQIEGGIRLGISFLWWAQHVEDPHTPFSWRPVQSDTGVCSLEKWVMRRQNRLLR